MLKRAIKERKERYTRQQKPSHVHDWKEEYKAPFWFHICTCGKEIAFDTEANRG